MKYKVLKAFKAKIDGEVVTFQEGQEIAIQEVVATKLIEMGRIIPIADKVTEAFEGQTPSVRPIKEGDTDIRGYRVTADDVKLNEYAKSKYNMNPNGHKCISCGQIAHRYCLGLGKDKKFWWGYQCLECSPYNEPERTN